MPFTFNSHVQLSRSTLPFTFNFHVQLSRSTHGRYSAEANGAKVFNVLARTANQAESQITGVACVVDGFGSGGGLTLRYVKSRMSSWTPGETVGHKEI